ncbi:MAG: MotA/TolQ/ExbB proton channel family protein [bacterium]
MDITSWVGIILGTLMLIGPLWLGGGVNGVMLFIDTASLLITLGGATASTLIHFPLYQILDALRVAKFAFFYKQQSAESMIPLMIDFATRARREGILALESASDEMNDPYLKKGIQLAVDGTEPGLVRDILETDLEQIEDRHNQGASIFDAFGYYAPAFGMVGTLMGLVQMLKSMDDPSKIGPAMAIALITTFYGAVAANFICMPIAAKLRIRSKEEALQKKVIIEGIALLQAGENPRVVEQKLNSFLPPKMRKASYK